MDFEVYCSTGFIARLSHMSKITEKKLFESPSKSRLARYKLPKADQDKIYFQNLERITGKKLAH